MKLEKTSLPEIGFVRIKEILKIFPIGKSTWWDGIKEGRFPKPVKLGEITSAWRVEDIRALIENPPKPKDRKVID
jgi:predicted DNA-binding transcriptional regulator AlpA